MSALRTEVERASTDAWRRASWAPLRSEERRRAEDEYEALRIELIALRRAEEKTRR